MRVDPYKEIMQTVAGMKLMAESIRNFIEELGYPALTAIVLIMLIIVLFVNTIINKNITVKK